MSLQNAYAAYFSDLNTNFLLVENVSFIEKCGFSTWR